MRPLAFDAAQAGRTALLVGSSPAVARIDPLEVARALAAREGAWPWTCRVGRLRPDGALPDAVAVASYSDVLATHLALGAACRAALAWDHLPEVFVPAVAAMTERPQAYAPFAAALAERYVVEAPAEWGHLRSGPLALLAAAARGCTRVVLWGMLPCDLRDRTLRRRAERITRQLVAVHAAHRALVVVRWLCAAERTLAEPLTASLAGRFCYDPAARVLEEVA